MTDIQRTQPNVSLPLIEEIEDEKLKKIFEDYNKIFFEIIPAIYSDIQSLIEKVSRLEGD
ncbi:hypothetical protein ES704_03022 [subsurface metagenome]|jgi:hypothetical protein